jgi:hypothetical protein
MTTFDPRHDRRAGSSTFFALTRQLEDAAVVMVEGRLGADALPVCRCAIDAALLSHPSRVVLDLGAATCDAMSLSVLGLIRRYADRHGVALWLSPTSGPILDWLRRDDLGDLYPVATAGVVGESA